MGKHHTKKHYKKESDSTSDEKPRTYVKSAYRKGRVLNNPYKDENKHSSQSEEELSFCWQDYRWELNILFFQDHDLISKDSEEYEDFWKFLRKYEMLQKQKKIRQICKQASVNANKNNISEKFGLPLKYDKRHGLNFFLKLSEISDLKWRLPPGIQERKKLLSDKKLEEFQYILLLYNDFLQRERFQRLKKLRSSQANLPIASFKEEIITTINRNSLVIIAGDTGCGKSTQVPQYLLSANFAKIACTQPRRIACISLSKRVSYETLNEYGSQVGYQIRFERTRTEYTRIVFLTEGLLLRQINVDTQLSQYNVVILDEIHERHLHTDFLLGIMKCLLTQRDDIKVVLMSATINIELFQTYFQGKVPIIQVPGRLYSVKLQYFPIPITEKSNKSGKLNPSPYIRILQMIDKQYSEKERGDLLIFLSGMNEILTIMEAAKVYAQDTHKWIIIMLHSTLSVSEQEKVFDLSPDGMRKCILSTNIAETSVTIDGVRFVVDSGKVKEMSYDAESKMQKLKEFWISQASAEQRKGRAGRTGPGACFRLYSEEEYASFSQYSVPEIKRVPLDSLVLQMVAMGLPNVRLFPFVEPPSSESIESSVESLKLQGALTANEQLTTIGQLLSQLPVDVSIGKMLIIGSLFHQVGPVLSLAAVMSVQSPFTNRAYRDPECVALLKSFESDHGDPFILLNVYREWLHVKKEGREHSRKWCKRRGLEEQRFYEVTKLQHQFSQLLKDSNFQGLSGKSTVAGLSSAARAKRHGELQKLRSLKRELKDQGHHKVKVLKVDFEGSINSVSDDEDRVDVKDVDFQIRNDSKHLDFLYKSCYVSLHKDIVLLKVILCSGLYPNVAIADPYNNYKSGSEQLFHTHGKPFTVLHPNGIFASHPEVLQITTADTYELPGFNVNCPASTKYQLLAYVSLLETTKPYLVNAIRISAAQILLLFSYNIDTNSDMSTLVCDSFIEIKFADPMEGQNLLFQAVLLREKWEKLLQLRIKCTKTDDLEDGEYESFFYEANKLEKDISANIIDFFATESLYSVRRLLAADVKVLHKGPGPEFLVSSNPFSLDDKPCHINNIKGGVYLLDYLTYNSLLETECAFSITPCDTVCPYCDKEFCATTNDRLKHMYACVYSISSQSEKNDTALQLRMNPNQKEYYCADCEKTYFLSLKDIFKHKQTHAAKDH